MFYTIAAVASWVGNETGSYRNSGGSAVRDSDERARHRGSV